MSAMGTTADSVDQASAIFNSAGYWMVYAAGGCLALAGLCTSLVGLQLWGVRFYDSLLEFVPYAWSVLGLLALAIGVYVARGRLTGAKIAVGFAPVLLLANFVFFVASLYLGIVSLMQVFAVAASLWAACFMPFALKPARAATEARLRLRADGLDLGI